MHYVEMQILADSKGKVALVDITLRANAFVLVLSVTEIIISRFSRDGALCKWKSEFSREFIFLDTRRIPA